MVQALWWLCRAERDLDPARHPGRCRVVLRDHHRHGPGRLTRRRCCEPLAPNEELARVQTVAPGHRRDRGRRVEALGHDPALLLLGPAPATPDAGDHLDPAKAVGLRTGRTTMSTHLTICSLPTVKALKPPGTHRVCTSFRPPLCQ